MVDYSIKNSPLNIFQKAFWRFILLFLIFYVVPYDLGYGFVDDLEELTFWDRPIMWVGEFFMGWEFNPNDLFKTFDTKFEFSRYLFVALIAFIGSLIWILIDRHLKKDYNESLKTFVQTILRYHIGIIMIAYGVSKIFLLQFGTMDIDNMEGTIGEKSPMGLMWVFMSFSKSVTMFSGWVEFIGAVLLFYRRTAFLGALLLFGIMSSVVLMDIGYDVSVTLYAIQLLVLIIALLSSQLKSLYAFVVLNSTATPSKYTFLFKGTKYHKAALIFKGVLLITIAVLYTNLFKGYFEIQTINRYSWFQAKHDVNTFVINGDTLTNCDTNNSKKWKKVIFNGTSYMTESFEVTNQDDEKERFRFEIDSTTRVIKFKPYIPVWDKTQKEAIDVKWDTLNYKKLAEKEYLFEGIYQGDTMYIKTKAKMIDDYNLIKNKGRFLLDIND